MTARLIVVKLGGSHAQSPLLTEWLHALTPFAGSLVIVPGGGAFADTVRIAQPSMQFDDAAAHDMALMAMSQFARALASIMPNGKMVEELRAIRDATGQRRIPIWSPWPMLRDYPGIPRSWQVTSDSLAVWLGRQVAAERIVIVKHCKAANDVPLETLAAEGIIDPAMPDFARAYRGTIHFAGPGDAHRLRQWFGSRPLSANQA